MKHKALGIWIHPGGHTDEFETPTHAIIREVKEETGLDIQFFPQSLIPKPKSMEEPPFGIVEEKIVEYPKDARYKDNTHYHITLLYAAKPKGKKKAVNNSNESNDMRWFTEKELEQFKLFKKFEEIYKYGFKRFGAKQ